MLRPNTFQNVEHFISRLKPGDLLFLFCKFIARILFKASGYTWTVYAFEGIKALKYSTIF